MIFVKHGYAQSSQFSTWTNIGTFSTVYKDPNGHPQILELDIMMKN